MFTGLIEEQGKIININRTSNGTEITVHCEKILSDIQNGASIAVNGACHTVTEFGKNYIKIQSSNETSKVSCFKNLKQGDNVNLERALTLNKRIDGHLVTGHIDCIGKFIKEEKDGFSKRLFFEIDKNFSKYIIYKGSTAINGVSLTIASIEDNVISVEVIPTTLKETNLSLLTPGDNVNIETDFFAKYIEKLLNSNDNTSKINYAFLTENGFTGNGRY